MKPIAKINFLIFLQIAVVKVCFAQSTYNETYRLGHDYYLQKRYVESALKYRETVEKYPTQLMGWERYNEACSWSLAHKTDSAFIALGLCINKDGFEDYDHLVRDTDFNYIHPDKRWQPLAEQCKRHMLAHTNMPLKTELETILTDDQKYRKQIDTTIKAYGMHSAQMEELGTKTVKQDSINLAKVERILDTGGWPAKKAVGGKALTALFLVIQHADLQTQEKYFPMMEKAVKTHDLLPDNFALLEDRIAIRKGKKQLYGSQVIYDDATKSYKVCPIEDEANVNKRRAEAGMQPLADYLKFYNIDYKAPGAK